MFGGLMKTLGSFGTIPDILMGKDPKEALMDNLKVAAVLGAGMAAPGLLGAAGGSAGAAGAAGAEAGSAGLLGAETGLNAAGYMAPEMGGMVAEQAAAPVVNMSSQAGMFDTLNAQSGGLLGRAGDAFNTVNKVAKPVGQAMDMAQSMQPQQQPMQAPTILPPTSSPTLAQIAQGYDQQALAQQQQEMQRRMMRRKQIGLLGGY